MDKNIKYRLKLTDINEIEESRTANRRLAKKRVQWLIEHSTSYQDLCCVDSLVLRNPLLRQAPKRYKQAEKKDNDTMTMKFLLHKDKEKKWKMPTHFQAHLAAQTHGRPLRSQKSLHFAFAPKTE